MTEPRLTDNPLEGASAIVSLATYSKAASFTTWKAEAICGTTVGFKREAGLGLGSKTALTVAPFTGPAAPFVAIGGLVAGLFGSIFGAHKRAVIKENQTLCECVPATQEAFRQLDMLVINGKLSGAQAIMGLEDLARQYRSCVSGIIQMNGKCNAACVIFKQLQAGIESRRKMYLNVDKELAARKKKKQVSTRLLIGGAAAVAAVALA